MRFILFILIFVSSLSFAAEYGHFFRADSGDGNNWNHSITLNEGDRFVFLGSDLTNRSGSGDTRDEWCNVVFKCIYQGNEILRDLKSFEEYRLFQSQYTSTGFGYTRDEASRTITGPCTITPQTDGGHSVVDYKIIRASEEEGGSKFTASLNSDGSRLAIGSKTPGSNAVTRVYEFDGSSWNQLGEDVE